MDIGEIAYKSDEDFLFRFKNVGSESVKIETVCLSCSCLAAEWTETEIFPNDSGIILIRTNTGRLGKFAERIIVYYNKSEYADTLFLSGNFVYNRSN